MPPQLTSRRRMAWMAVSTLAAAMPVFLLSGGGCNGGPASTQPSTDEQKQEQALRDPMGYRPQFESTPDVGDSSGFKKDLGDVFNP